MLIAIAGKETDIESRDYGEKMISHIYDTETDQNIIVSPMLFKTFLSQNREFQYNMLLDEYVVIKEENAL
jgi:hypothetical protein